MKGKIEKDGYIKKEGYGYQIIYCKESICSCCNSKYIKEIPVRVRTNDMDEFMDDIYSQYLKEKGKKSNKPLRETALELIERAKDKCLKDIGRDVVEVITKIEEAEQDRDRREIDNETKTYDNFPTDEALDFDLNVRERV